MSVRTARTSSERAKGENSSLMPAKKWQLLEGVVAAIERSLSAVPGTKVIPNAAVPVRGSRKTRQVDVLVEIPTGPRRIRVGVEVRNKRAPLDVTQVEQLAAKLSKLDLDRGCVVASSGFTTEGRQEAVRYGIELRTVAEIAAPNWWLPTSFQFRRRRVECFYWRLNYPPDQLDQVRKALAGSSKDLYLVIPTEKPKLLRSVVAAQGRAAVDNHSELQDLRDQDEFKLTIEMRLPEGSLLRCPSGQLPIPVTISAAYRFHHQIEQVPISAYEMGDSINAFSGVSAIDNKQLTVIFKPQNHGKRRIFVSFTDAAPKRTRIGSITDIGDHGSLGAMVKAKRSVSDHRSGLRTGRKGKKGR